MTATTAQKLLAACREIQRRFPAWKIPVSVECHPAMFTYVRECLAVGEVWNLNPLGGIVIRVRPDILPGCVVTRYVSGHFEISPGWCEIDAESDVRTLAPISVKWGV